MRVRATLVGALALVVVGLPGAWAAAGQPRTAAATGCTNDNVGSLDCPYGSDENGAPTGFYGADEQFPPDWFYFFGFVVVAGGITATVMRVRTASRLAERAGLDPGDAAWTSLLSENGLPATYAIANLPGRGAAPEVVATAAPRTVERRLAEVKRLHDKGLISPEEYETRRTRILDEV